MEIYGFTNVPNANTHKTTRKLNSVEKKLGWKFSAPQALVETLQYLSNSSAPDDADWLICAALTVSSCPTSSSCCFLFLARTRFFRVTEIIYSFSAAGKLQGCAEKKKHRIRKICPEPWILLYAELRKLQSLILRQITIPYRLSSKNRREEN